MPVSDEFVPESRIVQEVVQKELLPVIERCEETFNESLAGELFALVEGNRQFLFSVKGIIEPDSQAGAGEIRITFRKTFDPERIRFQIEGIYKGLKACASGFSGYSIKGEVKVTGNEIKVTSKGGSYRNNVWEFLGWI